MALTRIQDEGLQQHISQLMDSAGQLHTLAGQFTSAIENTVASWEGDGGEQWRGFGRRANEAQQDMTTTLTSIQSKVEGVQRASRSGQAEQHESVVHREGAADWADVEGNFRSV
ncbi:WXG100 family type VII secretion target [Gordonia sp. CPCC 205333]|uniref:WXG100 family type VII secretion target n=1 Tax=Gordonia sp. CPCC 205333 TaxID=3140790 RepID=UPI003AF370C2